MKKRSLPPLSGFAVNDEKLPFDMDILKNPDYETSALTRLVFEYSAGGRKSAAVERKSDDPPSTRTGTRAPALRPHRVTDEGFVEVDRPVESFKVLLAHLEEETPLETCPLEELGRLSVVLHREFDYWCLPSKGIRQQFDNRMEVYTYSRVLLNSGVKKLMWEPLRSDQKTKLFDSSDLDETECLTPGFVTVNKQSHLPQWCRPYATKEVEAEERYVSYENLVFDLKEGTMYLSIPGITTTGPKECWPEVEPEYFKSARSNVGFISFVKDDDDDDDEDEDDEDDSDEEECQATVELSRNLNCVVKKPGILVYGESKKCSAVYVWGQEMTWGRVKKCSQPSIPVPFRQHEGFFMGLVEGFGSNKRVILVTNNERACGPMKYGRDYVWTVRCNGLEDTTAVLVFLNRGQMVKTNFSSDDEDIEIKLGHLMSDEIRISPISLEGQGELYTPNTLWCYNYITGTPAHVHTTTLRVHLHMYIQLHYILSLSCWLYSVVSHRENYPATDVARPPKGARSRLGGHPVGHDRKTAKRGARGINATDRTIGGRGRPLNRRAERMEERGVGGAGQGSGRRRRCCLHVSPVVADVCQWQLCLSQCCVYTGSVYREVRVYGVCGAMLCIAMVQLFVLCRSSPNMM